jgi:hypothetical protein
MNMYVCVCVLVVWLVEIYLFANVEYLFKMIMIYEWECELELMNVWFSFDIFNRISFRKRVAYGIFVGAMDCSCMTAECVLILGLHWYVLCACALLDRVNSWIMVWGVEYVLRGACAIFRSALPIIFIWVDCGSLFDAVMGVWIWMIVTARLCGKLLAVFCLRVCICVCDCGG